MNRLSTVFLFLFFVYVGMAQATEIVYIYNPASPTDSISAISYKSLLDSSGYPTTLITVGQISSTNFSLYDAILIGNGSGSYAVWGDSASVAVVNNSNRPIIGLGEGGYAFFGRLSLQIGWAHGGHGSLTSIACVQPQHVVYTMPRPITVPSDSVVQLYSTGSGEVGIYLPSPPPDVILLGREPNDPEHYPVVQEKTRYLLWGFSSSPSGMTQVGKDLFLNVVDYMTKIYSTNSIAYICTSDPDWGNDFALLLASHGLTTTLVEKNSVAIADFSDYDLIIVESRTSFGYIWSDSTSVANIKNSGKPILGLGFGGAGLFGQMGLSINWGNGWICEDTTSTRCTVSSLKMYCEDPSMSIFRTPVAIMMPSDSIIQLYNRSGHIGVYEPALDSCAVRIGREPNNATHYSLTSESKHYLWGFTYPPANMTQTGKDLFYNIVSAMTQAVTAVEEDLHPLPKNFILLQNYPNPFNPSTTISYQLPTQSHVTLKVFDLLGREVTTLVHTVEQPGYKSVRFHANGLATGVYYYRLRAGNYVETKKLLLLR